MFLSPSAEPFEPMSSLEFAIFNDGIPSSVFYGENSEHDVVQMIPDDAIEELFPPSEADMAELDAADEFVETMAWLSYLDEVDEQARLNFAGFGKRWAARRKDGLVGKPHPAKPETRTRSGTIGSDEVALVPYTTRVFEARPRKVGHGMHFSGSTPKNIRGMHGHKGLIQQPRKHY